MRIYFDIIFIVLNIIIFAVNFHFALESKSIVLLLSADLNQES